LVERATAATAVQQGATENRQVTLGEIQLAFANAQQRISSISKFYIEGWQDFGLRYYKMLEAAGTDMLDPMTLYKKSYKGNVFKKTITTDDHRSKEGYRCKVVSKADREEERIAQLQSLNAAKQAIPENPPLEKIFKKKILDLADLTPDEEKEVMDYEEQKLKAIEEQANVSAEDMAAGATTLEGRPMLAESGKPVGANTQRLMQLMAGGN